MKLATPHWLTAATAVAIVPLAPYVNLWAWLVALLLLSWRAGQDYWPAAAAAPLAPDHG
jgi:hypothetical protein